MGCSSFQTTQTTPMKTDDAVNSTDISNDASDDASSEESTAEDISSDDIQTEPSDDTQTELSDDTQTESSDDTQTENTAYDSDSSGKEENQPDSGTISYTFRNETLLNQHYQKHGIEMGFSSAKEYEAAASAVIQNPNALYKTEQEDGDGVYYLESTNEFVIVSTDGYIRTYFYPNAGIKYFNRQ